MLFQAWTILVERNEERKRDWISLVSKGAENVGFHSPGLVILEGGQARKPSKSPCRTSFEEYISRWWFQIFFFSSLPGEMIQFD